MYNTISNGLEYVPELASAIDAVDQALQGGDPETIKRARLVFTNTRKKLLVWLIDQEVDAECDGRKFVPDPMVVSISEKDKLLFERLITMDKEEIGEIQSLAEEKLRKAMREEKNELPRKICVKTLSPSLIDEASSAMFYLWESELKITLRTRLNKLRIIIESAVAKTTNQRHVNATEDDRGRFQREMWNHIISKLGSELRALAQDYSHNNQNNWDAMCTKIYDIYKQDFISVWRGV